jgi:pyrimidine deaminase RibD-like protein
MYLPLIIAGKKVAIVDCLVSTGGTVKAIIEAIKKLPDTKITGIYCLNNKSNYGKQNDSIDGYDFGYLFDTRINESDAVEAKFSRRLKIAFWQNIDSLFFNLAREYSQLSNFSKRGYQVGALIVAADTFEIVAWGYRRGNIHAEQDAISMLKNNCLDWEKRDFTLYTTMEPCAYRNGDGYTCCSDIINQIPQIRWVVIGEVDSSDQKINGAGIEKLTQNKNIRMIQSNEVIRAINPVPHFSSISGI